MEDQELELLLGNLESDRIERKASFADREEIRKAICAFSNDLPGNKKPGLIFVGVHDDGSCADLPITDEMLRLPGAIRQEGNIQPIPSVLVEKRILKGCEVAVIMVQPSRTPPVRLRGRVWIRIGPRRATATPEEERRLVERRQGWDLPFDVQAVPSTRLDDLDLLLFEQEYLPRAIPSEVLEGNKRTSHDRLQALRFLSAGREPTVLGLLVVGKQPRDHIPGAYVQFLRLDGKELTDPVRDAKVMDGPLPQLLRGLDEILEAHNEVAVSITESNLEIRRPLYPLSALQQLVRNAVLHRTYQGTNAPVRINWFEDRLEILSPGGPFGQVTAENFGLPGITDYRNPHLAEAMKVLGYVQKFGVGLQIARLEMEKNGNPPPEFRVEPSQLLAVLRRSY